MPYPILFSFVGNRDPYNDRGEDEYGPLLSHLQTVPYNRCYLICTGPEYYERARTVEEIARETTETGKFNFINLDLKSPVDYEEIYTKLKDALDRVMEQLPAGHTEHTVLLDPGTPQMQTVWFLLVKSGHFRARLVQGVPPRFAAGVYKVKEVNLESSVLPDIVLPDNKETGPVISHQPNLKDFEESPGDRWISGTRLRIIGKSESFLKTFEVAGRYAGYNVNVLIFGETGSGKGIFAQYIHEHSLRREKPMMEINCSAIPDSLVESELFGYVKGSFTGADRDRLGLFRTADGGTVFLDEIGDLPKQIQPKLLKVIEDNVLTPVGADKPVPVDVRIIAATNISLEEKIESGDFRRDLYERLNQVSLTIPPLREREEDIADLAETFLSEWNREYGEEKTIATECFDYFLQYPWPGNVRELRNAVQTLCAKSRDGLCTPEMLPSRVLSYFREHDAEGPAEVSIPENGIDVKAVLYDLEKRFYEEALKKAEGNGEKAAKLLGINGAAFRKACRERFELLE